MLYELVLPSDGRKEAFRNSESIDQSASQNDSLFQSFGNSTRWRHLLAKNSVNATKTQPRHA